MVENIKKLCAGRGISLRQLEAACGISYGTICRWDENRPSVDRAAKVAAFFGISLETLLNEKQ